jgi:hypothetical protein
MDWRNFGVTGELDDGRVLVQAGEPEPDLQDVISKNVQYQAPFEQGSSLLMWGIKAFQEGSSEADPWEERLAEAMALEGSVKERTGTEETMIRGGLAYVAAVCLRDQWDRLDAAQMEWCLETVLRAVNRRPNSDDWSFIVARNGMEEARPGAYILALVYCRTSDETTETRVKTLLSVALTHACAEVREYAAAGIGRFLWGRNVKMALCCVGLCLRRAQLAHEYHTKNQELPWEQRVSYGEVLTRANREVKDTFESISTMSVETALSACDFGECEGEIGLLLNMLATREADETGRTFMLGLCCWLARLWRERESQRRRDREHENYELESHCLQRIAQFSMCLPAADALIVCDPLIQSTEQIPDKVAQLIDEFLCEADRGQNRDTFWAVWEAISEKMLKCRWLSHLPDEHSWGENLTRALYLGAPWKEGVRDWTPLGDNWQKLDALFTVLPICVVTLEAYCRYLYYVGEISLPHAFQLIREALKSDEDLRLLGSSNISYYLDSLLRRFVYGKPTLVKRNKGVRESTLFLLDAMVENGSSSAYLIREDLVTPLVPA